MEETQEADLKKVYEIIKSHMDDNFSNMPICKAYWECLIAIENYYENLDSISI